MELRKSYKGLIMWIVFFFIIMFGTSFLPIKDGEILTRIVLNICIFSIVLLTFIIYKTEYVYWYNGTTYEEAVQAGSERRKIFAWKHLKKFAIFAIVYLITSIALDLLEVTIFIDVILVMLGSIITAISTITIKL